MADERRRLHEIVDQLPEKELGLACQLLDLLTRGREALQPAPANGHDEDTSDQAEASPETIRRLSQLTDAELLQLDAWLESDTEAARRFWRERFDEELPDHELS
ncbi:MAG: hypothetical protein AB7P40_14345 [Chloroflexota bacterium]